MTNQQHPALFDWATELLDAEGHVTLSAKEAHEIGARLRSMGEKLKAYEDLDEAASDVQLLRIGYAAARLEIESLQARIKTMAEEHADELMVAHLDGMRAAQPAPQQEAASVDLKTMELAESVGLIGPASRTHDLHAAIQRFHDLICANATIKAAQMAAEAISEAAPQADSVLEDAERYRWLRQEHERVDPVCHLTWKRNLQRDSAEWVNTAVLDTAIDNARKQGANHD